MNKQNYKVKNFLPLRWCVLHSKWGPLSRRSSWKWHVIMSPLTPMLWKLHRIVCYLSRCGSNRSSGTKIIKKPNEMTKTKIFKRTSRQILREGKEILSYVYTHQLPPLLNPQHLSIFFFRQRHSSTPKLNSWKIS